MEKFYVTKAISADKVVIFIDELNTKTRDGYVVDQTRIARNLWLVRIACTHRDDAAFVRDL